MLGKLPEAYPGTEFSLQPLSLGAVMRQSGAPSRRRQHRCHQRVAIYSYNWPTGGIEQHARRDRRDGEARAARWREDGCVVLPKQTAEYPTRVWGGARVFQEPCLLLLAEAHHTQRSRVCNLQMTYF